MVWERWAPDLIVQKQTERKKTFIDFTADWCLTCKVNEKLVINTNDGSEANTPHTKTLFVKYTASNTSTGRKAFTNNEILTSTDGSGLNCNTIVGTLSVPAVGTGLAMYFDSGVIYGKDHFIRVPAQTLIIGKYDERPTKRIGFDIIEAIVTETSDETLLDPAQGAYNYAAPGAARLKLTVGLKSLDIDEIGRAHV